jgi:hypothetical protein
MEEEPMNTSGTAIEMAVTEPEMEHYLRLAGWVQAQLYPMNWVDPKSPTRMTVFRVRQATSTQMKRDRDMITELQSRLAIVGG